MIARERISACLGNPSRHEKKSGALFVRGVHIGVVAGITGMCQSGRLQPKGDSE